VVHGVEREEAHRAAVQPLGGLNGYGGRERERERRRRRREEEEEHQAVRA